MATVVESARVAPMELELDRAAVPRAQSLLPRTLTVLNGISLVIGTIIGSGIFASPGVVAEHAGSAGMALAIWLMCGLLAFAGSLAYAELGAAIPSSGGEVVYLERAFGPLVSFLFSAWTLLFKARVRALIFNGSVDQRRRDPAGCAGHYQPGMRRKRMPRVVCVRGAMSQQRAADQGARANVRGRGGAPQRRVGARDQRSA